MKIDGTPPDDLQPLDPALGEEVYEWASELRVIWSSTGLSISRFARLNPVNKGTVSRWLAGERVPRDPWFLDRVLAIRAERGTPVTDEVREHLTELHLRALQAAHPHEYRVRLISDELMTARTRQQERERYARELEGQLLERNRRIEELSEGQRRLRAAMAAGNQARQVEFDQLTREVRQLTAYLQTARNRATEAELRGRQLENQLDQLAPREMSDDPDGELLVRSVALLESAALEGGYD